MKIIALQAENIKKLVAVEIKPDGNLVQITGANGQGKTSVLDSIWWALAGASHIQSTPIRKGQNEARIRLDMGEIVVVRKFKTGDEGETISSLTVENADGARFPSPQAMLDNLLGSLSFDPLAFARMKSDEQFNQLRRFVPDVDFNAIDMANKADYQRRTDINRRAKEARIQSEKIIITTVVTEQPIDEAALVTKLESAGKHNTDLETRKANREKFATEARTKRDRIAAIALQVVQLQQEADQLTAEADGLEDKLKKAPALPAPLDTTIIKGEIENAKRTNAAITAYAHAVQQKESLATAAAKLEVESDELTKAMEAREKDKQAKVAAAKLPVPGITFGDGVILMAGVPFEQASDAEQLRASIAIAMALNPTLRVIRVRDGSLLDSGSMKLLDEMAKDQDYQVWIEKVEDSGKVGICLEDGHVKSINGKEVSQASA